MDIKTEENVLKILANPIRKTIVMNLHKDKLSFTHLMQITGCKTGQLSFHLNKLEYLVEQDELKRYKLSDKGKDICEAILPRLAAEEGHNVSEEEIEVGFAFKKFTESFIYLISSCIFTVKYIVVHSWKRFIDVCSRATGYIKNLVSDSGSHFGKYNSFLQRANNNVKSFNRRLRQMIIETVNSLKSNASRTVKSIKRSINPLLSYSFIILGIMLFIPAVFVSVSPGFNPILNSVAEVSVSKPHLSDDQMVEANQLYEQELLPNQRFYEDFNYTRYTYMNYINQIGYPLTAERVEAWRVEYIKNRIQFFKDVVFAALSVSSVMMLIGGLLAFDKKLHLKRFLISTMLASTLLLMASVVLLIIINATVTANYYQTDKAIGSVTFLLKNLIGILLLIIFSSSGLSVYLKTRKKSFNFS